MSLKLIKSRLIKPYLSNGKTNIPNKKQSGVYMIYENEKIVYIGYSAKNLYKTLYRHFQKWNDSQTRITYSKTDDNIKIRVIYTNNGYQAYKLERALIVKHVPRDNPNKYREYILNKSDNKTVQTLTNQPTTDIYVFKGDLPF